MKKIKPLQKKHRFIKWLKKLFGIKSHSIGEWKDIDEMHLLKDDKIYQVIKEGTTKANEITREEVIREFGMMICWLENSIIPCARRNGKDIGLEHSTLKFYRRAVELLKEDERLIAHNENLKKENKYLRERLAEEMEHKKDMEGKDGH
jgi:hypothetical protein